jgi:hypothetical protein
MLRFALVGPVVGSIVYFFVSRLGPALSEHMPEHEHVKAIVTSLIESVLAGAYGVIFMIPMTGTLGAIAGLIYWLLLKNRKLGNWRPSGRALVGGTIGLLCALSVGALIFNARNTSAGFEALCFWAIAGAAAGACSGLTIGESLYEVILPFGKT